MTSKRSQVLFPSQMDPNEASKKWDENHSDRNDHSEDLDRVAERQMSVALVCSFAILTTVTLVIVSLVIVHLHMKRKARRRRQALLRIITKYVSKLAPIKKLVAMEDRDSGRASASTNQESTSLLLSPISVQVLRKASTCEGDSEVSEFSKVSIDPDSSSTAIKSTCSTNNENQYETGGRSNNAKCICCQLCCCRCNFDQTSREDAIALSNSIEILLSCSRYRSSDPDVQHAQSQLFKVVEDFCLAEHESGSKVDLVKMIQEFRADDAGFHRFAGERGGTNILRMLRDAQLRELQTV